MYGVFFGHFSIMCIYVFGNTVYENKYTALSTVSRNKTRGGLEQTTLRSQIFEISHQRSESFQVEIWNSSHFSPIFEFTKE